MAIRQLAEARRGGDEELAGVREELEAVASRLSLATTELEDYRLTNSQLNAQVRLLTGELRGMSDLIDGWGRGRRNQPPGSVEGGRCLSDLMG